MRWSDVKANVFYASISKLAFRPTLLRRASFRVWRESQTRTEQHGKQDLTSLTPIATCDCKAAVALHTSTIQAVRKQTNRESADRRTRRHFSPLCAPHKIGEWCISCSQWMEQKQSVDEFPKILWHSPKIHCQVLDICI
jgi:hypothetical protein